MRPVHFIQGTVEAQKNKSFLDLVVINPEQREILITQLKQSRNQQVSS